MSQAVLPKPVIMRLPRYLTHVREIRDAGVEWVSSIQLGKVLSLTSSTVRQDLSHLDLQGVSKRGYEVSRLEKVLSKELGAKRVHRAVIVGAGYLGCALALHAGLEENSFEVCAILDSDWELVGTKVGGVRVRPMDSLKNVVDFHKVEIGIIAVPSGSAQRVADLLIESGVTGLLNLAATVIRVPDDVILIDARLLASLQELAYLTRARERLS